MKTVDVIVGRVSNGEFPYSVVMDAPEVPFGLNGTGRSIDEAKADFTDAYEEMKDLMEEAGEAYEELNFNYKYDIPSFLNYYAHVLSLAGLERISGINQRQLSHYINGSSKPRKATVERFKQGLKAFADDLSSIDVIWTKSG